MAINTAPSFSTIGDGKVTTDFGFTTTGFYVTPQTDGKLIVTALSSDFTVARYNSDGTLDADFDGDGKITTDFADSFDRSFSIAVQTDGKILVAGRTDHAGTKDFALVRYNPDGSLDSGFDGDGKVTTSIGTGDDGGLSVAIQADGKILVSGWSINDQGNDDFALVRYNPDGSLDSGFGNDGKVITSIGSVDQETAWHVTVQADGKILLAGLSYSEASKTDFALARYNADGSLDSGFGDGGKVTTALSSSWDEAYSAVVLADGKILAAGFSDSGDQQSADFALARYNSDGSLDTRFGDGGKVISDFGATEDGGSTVLVQADGKVIIAGYSVKSRDNYDFALARYNPDGSLDLSFGDQGKVITDFGTPENPRGDSGLWAILQADGKIVVVGESSNELALARYNPDGSLDATFDTNSLNRTARYYSDGETVVLDDSVEVIDAELAALGHYNGASVTLTRHGGASSDDVFSGSGRLSFDNGDALLDGITIGTVSHGNGVLTLTFNADATQERVNGALSSLAYRNTAVNPSGSVQIDWTFNDGSALTASGATTVYINAYSAPFLFSATPIIYTDTALHDAFQKATGKFDAYDDDSPVLTYCIEGGTDNGDGTIGIQNAYGALIVKKESGVYRFTPNDAAMERLTADTDMSFTFTVSDGVLTDSNSLNIHIAQSGVTESTGNDTLTGTKNNDLIKALNGDDKIDGDSGADSLYGGNGDDLLYGRAGDDLLNGGGGDDVLVGGAGQDIFAFIWLANGKVDRITDFTAADDTIQLENTAFISLTAIGELAADHFAIGTASFDADDYLVYDDATGALFYDADGNGAGVAVQIATLGAGLALTNADFAVN